MASPRLLTPLSTTPLYELTEILKLVSVENVMHKAGGRTEHVLHECPSLRTWVGRHVASRLHACRFDFASLMVAHPGTDSQQWHEDADKDATIVQVYVHDVSSEQGPTQFADTGAGAGAAVTEASAPLTFPGPAGTLVLYSGKTRHRGLVNATTDDRTILALAFVPVDRKDATTDTTAHRRHIKTIGSGVTATTLPATSITQNSVTLHGTANAGGFGGVTTYFEYGTSPGSLNLSTAPVSVPGSTDHAQDVAVTGLLPTTVYHYRLVDSVSGSVVVAGATLSFTTTATSADSVIYIIGGMVAFILIALMIAGILMANPKFTPDLSFDDE